jgi:hypothetical protein
LIICETQEFHRGGNNCLAGSGIYFAEDPDDTHHKRTCPGPILEATILLGNMKTIDPIGDKSITFTTLQREGYDSVKIPRKKWK